MCGLDWEKVWSDREIRRYYELLRDVGTRYSHWALYVRACS